MDKYMRANMVFSKFSRDYMELKRDLPIRPSEMGVLNIITRRDGDFTPLMLAELLGVSKPMIAAHLRALLRKRYIYKEASPDDKRSFYVRPTETGRALADEFEIKQREHLRKIEAGLGEDKFNQLADLLCQAQIIMEETKEV